MFSVTIRPDLMEASLRLDAEFDASAVTETDILQYLVQSAHVEESLIDIEAIRKLLSQRGIAESAVVARGIEAVKGADGWLRWSVDCRPLIEQLAPLAQQGAPLRAFTPADTVARNGLIVTMERPESGGQGRNVFGKRIAPQAGAFSALPIGSRNVIVSPDQTKMHAARSGRVMYANGAVDVVECFQFNGNLSAESGKLLFDGDVLISGNVLGGAQINATGRIEVEGVVAGAFLQAGDDIVVRGGIRAAGQGSVIARNSVVATEIEYATVEAGGSVAAQSISHSNVLCGETAEVLFGEGKIVGGNTCAGKAIRARQTGNEEGQNTILEVGTFPKQCERLGEVEKELSSLDEQTLQVMTLARALPESDGVKDRELRNRLARELIALRDKRAAAAGEKAALEEVLRSAVDGEISIAGTAYAGCRIGIGASRGLLGKDLHQVAFRLENNAIIHRPI